MNVITKDQSYESKVTDIEGKKLQYYTENAQSAQRAEKKVFTDLSLKTIFQNVSFTLIAIINDILAGQIKKPSDVIMVLFKEDRMIYLGLIIMTIAFCIYIIDITS